MICAPVQLSKKVLRLAECTASMHCHVLDNNFANVPAFNLVALAEPTGAAHAA
jgi:hypothetical protein